MSGSRRPRPASTTGISEPGLPGRRKPWPTVRLDILKGNQVIPKAVGLAAVAAAGTAAQTKLGAGAQGDIVQVHALIRIALGPFLAQLGPTPKVIPLPVEFVLLDLEWGAMGIFAPWKRSSDSIDPADRSRGRRRRRARAGIASYSLAAAARGLIGG
jgi:hypothetical protein